MGTMLEGMLAGGALVLAGFLLGRLPSRRKGPKPPGPVEAKCGCTHHHSFHDPATGACGASVAIDKRSKSGSWIGQEYLPCACKQYSGPVPLPEYFATEIATGDGNG
jgi:hypothetical protein